jgi:hypothetical protein
MSRDVLVLESTQLQVQQLSHKKCPRLV